MENNTKELTLGDLENHDSYERTYPALIGGNMGHKTLKLNLSIADVISNTRVYNAKTVKDLGHSQKDKLDAQRPLYEKHAANLARYIIIGLVESNLMKKRANNIPISQHIKNLIKQLGDSEYSCLQPFVTNIRDCERDGSDLRVQLIKEQTEAGSLQDLDGVIKVKLSQKQIMSIVDGQHRRYGFDLVMKWLTDILQNRKYPKVGLFNPSDTFTHGDRLSQEIYDFWAEIQDIAIKESFVAVECHLGATPLQERQIFSDLNSKGKKVELSLSLDYDSSDAVNNFVKTELIENGVLKTGIKIKDSADWQDDEGHLLRKDLNLISCRAMFGTDSKKAATPADVNSVKGTALKFWEVTQQIKHFGSKKSRTKTIAAQPVVLKAIARLFFDLSYGKGGLKNKDHLVELITAIKSGKLDFSHSEVLWRSLMLNTGDREKAHPGISKYVHVPEGTNLDAGTYDVQNNWVRYGSKHNDIYYRIADLIRFKMGWEPRPAVTRALSKL